MPQIDPQWQPFREPLRTTLTRTIGLAVVAGGVLALRWGGFARWPLATTLMLWPFLGGHWLELWFLNALRPRLAFARPFQISARLATWFAGGVVFAQGMVFTAGAFTEPQRTPWSAWWIPGLGFIGIELIVHALSHLRGRPNFFDGRG